MIKKAKKYKSFTLIEVIVAIFILTVGVLAVFGVIADVFNYISFNSSKLKAIYLAQEGLEIVKNIRDTNYLKKRNNPGIQWDNGLPEGEWEADYDDESLGQLYAGSFLNIDSNNFYSYSPGSPTPFKRKIKIEKLADDILRVTVDVLWEEKGRSHKVSVQEELHDWW